MSDLEHILAKYLAAAKEVEAAFGDMTREQLFARPVEDQWSSLQLLCHLVDTDLLSSTRIRAALSSVNPRQLGLTTEQMMGMVAWEHRDAAEEIAFFVALRSQTARIVRSFAVDPSGRALIIVKPDGTEVTKTVGQLLIGDVDHASNHMVHVQEKRRRLGLSVNNSDH